MRKRITKKYIEKQVKSIIEFYKKQWYWILDDWKFHIPWKQIELYYWEIFFTENTKVFLYNTLKENNLELKVKYSYTFIDWEKIPTRFLYIDFINIW